MTTIFGAKTFTDLAFRLYNFMVDLNISLKFGRKNIKDFLKLFSTNDRRVNGLRLEIEKIFSSRMDTLSLTLKGT